MEIWKPLFRFYEVSNLGRIRNCKRNIVLKDAATNNGYRQVSLYLRKGVSVSRTVHRLIAEAFLGTCPVGFEVNHKDGNKTNNCADNLEYATRSANQLHAYKLGLAKQPHGAQSHRSKLKAADVLIIRNLLALGINTQKEIGNRFGVKRNAISQISLGITWKNI